jgi:uncharacterized protein (TIGR01777 family)
MTPILWTALLAQIAMGGFDTLFHHELTERLAWRPSQRTELGLHGVRNLAYGVMFLALGWTTPHGVWAIALIALMTGELGLTLWDFVEEDLTRKLPASERVTHTLLTLNYGIILAMLVPVLLAWSALPSALLLADHGIMNWLCAGAAVGVALFGLHDLAAARRSSRLVPAPAGPLAAALSGHKSVLVSGGTGFIGARLVEALIKAGHEVTVLTRHRAAAAGMSAPVRIVTALDQIPADARIDAIVNLAGEAISDMPWTRAKRHRILRSRLLVTREVLRLIRRLDQKPEVLISGSAIGWYGLRGDENLTEASCGTACFSRRICVAWEGMARRAEAQGVRTILLRTGLVLDHSEGMLARLLTPFEFGLGGRFGNGRHWMSWIHRDDLVRLIVHGLATPALRGPVNGTAPAPVTNRAFTTALGRALHRPAIVPIPAAPLRLILGDFAEELLLSGQRVYPQAALDSGFVFRFADIDSALSAIVGKNITAKASPRGKRHAAAMVPAEV